MAKRRFRRRAGRRRHHKKGGSFLDTLGSIASVAAPFLFALGRRKKHRAGRRRGRGVTTGALTPLA
jgi:hypothetical protein